MNNNFIYNLSVSDISFQQLYLQSILWVHEEVSADVVEHDGVFLGVKFSVLPPYHTERFYLGKKQTSQLNKRCGTLGQLGQLHN